MARTNTNNGGGGGGSGVEYNGTATGFSAGMIQYIDQSGKQSGDSLFTRDSDIINQTNMFSRTYSQASGENRTGDTFLIESQYQGSNPTIVFDGVSTTDTIVNAYNIANPSDPIVVISGGTIVPRAGSYEFIGGGQTGTQIGKINIMGMDLYGTGTISNDNSSSGIQALNFQGNLSPLFGSSEFGYILGTVSGSGINVLIADSNILKLQHNGTRDTSVYLSDKGASIGFGDKNFQVDSGTNMFIFNSSSSQIKLPFGLTPTSGEVLAVTGVSGSTATLGFVSAPSGSTPAGLYTYVQFNDGGSFGASSDFTFNKTTKDFAVGDIGGTGGNGFISIKNSSNSLQISGDYFSLQSRDKTSVFPLEFLNFNKSTGNSVWGDSQGENNSTYIYNDDFNNAIYGNGFRRNTLTTNTYTPSSTPGPNSNAGEANINVDGYNGNNNNNQFNAVISNLDTQRLNITSVTGTFAYGNILTGGTSGASASILDTDGSSYVVVENVVGGPFSPTEPITNSTTAGVCATSSATPITDVYTLQNGGNTQNFVPCGGAPGPIFQGTYYAFDNYTGHALGDMWYTVITVKTGNLFRFDGANKLYTIGNSKPALGSVAYTEMNGAGGGLYKVTSKSVNFRNYDTSSDYFNASINNPGVYAQIKFGDIPTLKNGTLFELDDQFSRVKINATHYNVPLVAYSSDADAGTGGLVTGDHYQTDGTGSGIFANVGVVMIKQ